MVMYAGNKEIIKWLKNEEAVNFLLNTLAKDQTMRAAMIYWQKERVEINNHLENLVNNGLLESVTKGKEAELAGKQEAAIRKFAEALQKRFSKEYDEMVINYKTR
jgi:16S rRNA G1207 methylase RsmC